MPRLLKNIGYALVFLILVLILVNIFIIMPGMRLQPEQVYTPESQAVEGVEPEEAVVTVDTLTIIKKEDKAGGGLYLDPDDEKLRNPFFWPEEKPQQTKNETIAIPVKPEPKIKPLLSMVITGNGRNQALLDNVFVREGDMFHGYLVKKIQENGVILSDSLGDLRIVLSSGDGAGQQGPPPGGLIER